MKQKHKKLVNKAIVIGCLTFFIVLFSLMKLSQPVAEYFFARGISRAYVFLAGNIASWFPFSLFDIFVTFGILSVIVCIPFFIYYLKKKRGWKAAALLERVAIAVLTVLLLYTVTASGNYYREKVPLPMYEGEQLTGEETAELVDVLMDDYVYVSGLMKRDENGITVCPYDFDELTERIRKEYRKLDDPYFSSYVPRAKEGWYSKFLTSEGITGITFLPTGDAVVNKETPHCYKTVTTAHEIAHAVGCMREGDANMMAYYVLLKSEDPYFRYCAYMYSLGHVLQVLRIVSPELYRDIAPKYPSEARTERLAEDAFWESRYSFMDDVGEFLNDLYLKMSGSGSGTESYHDYSNYSVTYDEKTQEVKEIKVTYSQTTRVMFRIAQERRGE